MSGTILSGETVFQNVVTGLFNPLYQLVAACAFVYFLYGVTRFIYDLVTSNPERQTLGRSHLLWGLVGLFIIFSIGGILPWFNDIFGRLFSY